MNNISILQMMQVSDSLFPIGAFTLSNGLETFVIEGRLSSDEDLKNYLNSYVSVLPYNELGVMLLSYKYADDLVYIKKLDEYFTALRSPVEVRMGSKKLCSRFLKIWDEIKDYERLIKYKKLIKDKECYGNHSIAVGLYAKDIGLEREIAAAVYCYSLLSAIVTNAVKTVPLSQLAGQKILNEALAEIEEKVKIADQLEMEELGITAPIMDIAAMNHECLYSRLYMS